MGVVDAALAQVVTAYPQASDPMQDGYWSTNSSPCSSLPSP